MPGLTIRDFVPLPRAGMTTITKMLFAYKNMTEMFKLKV